jgi:Ca2+-binding RTX toxin-like protein
LAGLCAAAVLLSVAAAPASAQTNGFACRAETLRSSLNQEPPLTPFVAGSDTEFCRNDDGGLPGAGESVGGGILLDAAYAQTRINDPLIAPAYQVATARSGVANAALTSGDSEALRVQAIEAESVASCVNRQLRFDSTGHVAKLFVFGQEIPINDGLTQIINGADGVTQTVVHIELNEEVRTGPNYTFRALHVTVPEDGSVLDVSVGENRLNAKGDPCNDFTGTGPGPQIPDRPIVGLPYGGGNVVELGDVKGARSNRCFRSRAFGRKVAIVGTNRADTIVGSRFSDRIFVYGGNDIVSSGRARDCVVGGRGRDKISTDHSGDTLYGNQGKDRLDGGLGPDLIFGGGGQDRLLAGLGKDRLLGGPGGDRISGRGGSDRLKGGKGNDRIYADFRGRPDRVRCGPGYDRIYVDRYDKWSRDCERVVVNLPFLQ